MRVLLQSRPTGALRLAFRLPIYLYQLNLGWLLGHKFLLLIHRGRKSGLIYQTMLEVVRYDPATQESVVLSGCRELGLSKERIRVLQRDTERALRDEVPGGEALLDVVA